MPLAQEDYLKLVVRNLPPLLSAETFKKACGDEFGELIKWSCYTPGKDSAKGKRSATAHVKLGSHADVLDFKAAFEGRQFVEKSISQAPVSVEYAPLQRVPGSKVKRDPREGTIEQDAAYRDFREALDRGPELLPSAALLPEPQQKDGKKQPVITPLMAHLAETTVVEAKPSKQLSGRSGRSKQQQLQPLAPQPSRSTTTKNRQAKSLSGAASAGLSAKSSKNSRQAAAETANSGAQKSGKPKATAVEAPVHQATAPLTSAATKRGRGATKAPSAAGKPRPTRTYSENDRVVSASLTDEPAVDGRAAARGMAAREAARNALSALAFTDGHSLAAAAPAGGEPKISSTATKGPEKAKKKEKLVRPGYGTYQRSRGSTDDAPPSAPS